MESISPLVTVVVPTYQRPKTLQRAIESVLTQDYPNIEIIIGDNASTDGTEALCRDLEQHHANITYIRRPANVGATANFELLRSEGTGKYFAFLGDDDWFSPGYLSTCIGALEADPQVAVAAGRSVYHHPDKVVAEPNPIRLTAETGPDRVVDYYRLVRANGVFYGVVRSDVNARVGALRNCQGADMVHVAERAYLGKVLTFEQVSINRAVGGATVNLANVARSLGLGWFQTYLPQLAIVWWAVRDIAVDSPVYANLTRPARGVLAARAGWAVGRRFLPEAAGKAVRLATGSLRGLVGHP